MWGWLIAGAAVLALIVYRVLHSARDDAEKKFGEGEVGDPCTECKPKELSDIERAGKDAFKRDQNGDIVAVDDGNPIIVGHGGAQGEGFRVQPVKLQLKDGTWIEGYRSLNQSTTDGTTFKTDYRFQADCHGVTFAEGKYWINDDQVDTMITGGGFKQTATPKVGDIGVYRDSNGSVVHSVTVSQVDANGKVTEVSGLGGIEMKEHADPPNRGWGDPNATITYYGK